MFTVPVGHEAFLVGEEVLTHAPATVNAKIYRIEDTSMAVAVIAPSAVEGARPRRCVRCTREAPR